MKPLVGDADAVRSGCRVTRSAIAPPNLRYPVTSIIRLHRGPLAKLAWIFGSRLRQKSSAKEI
jgi:hypothetical protein